ncbi:MAG: hypothetical protein LBQ13_00605, partial [Endomicrobium sp.]|nr:hypothetical protein [Endomicrobium sp.]
MEKKYATPIEQIINHRRQKAKDFVSAGINPYPSKCFLDKNNSDIQEKFVDLEKDQVADIRIKAAGRVITYRNMGKAAFLDIKDGYAKIQIYIRADKVGTDQYKFFKNTVDTSDIIA